MASESSTPHKPACSICACRKVKCDKGNPCSNCLKAQAQCIYEAPALHRRPRKRAADEDLLTRLAAYEDLMRKHNVDFSAYAQTWVSSKQETQFESNKPHRFVPLTPAMTTPGSRVDAIENIPTYMERCLRSNLSPELKNPPIQGLCHKDDPLLLPMPSLQYLFSPADPEVSQQHPEPRYIYRFWQIFIENVNPLLKIVHVPTLQQRIMDASWDSSKAPKPLVATMFAIYTLSITSMSSEDCRAAFGEARDSLLSRYRATTFRALVEAEFLTSKDFEVLQAFVLFLFTSPECELTSTLTAAAIKVAKRMGMQQSKPDPKISFFEQEMRIRLWWQLYGLEARTRALMMSNSRVPPSKSEFGDVRPPLNINDADLHPDMTKAPVEHTGATEMMCVLMKYEVFKWIRSSPTAANVFENIVLTHVRDTASMKMENKAIDEIEAIYYDKYLRYMDKRIPLQALTFKVHHPRGRVNVGGEESYLTREENDIVFNLAMDWLEFAEMGLRSQFASHIFTHMASKSQINALVYVISDLRRRYSGERVTQAWELVERFYEEHPELHEDKKSTFLDALRDMTLEAWEARRKELVYGEGVGERNATPTFILSLEEMSRKRQEANAQRPAATEFENLDGLGLTVDGNLDWEYWNNFLGF